MARVEDPDQIKSKRKALIALFPYAVWLERGGDCRVFDAYFDIFAAPKLRMIVAEPIIMLLDEANPNSPNWVVTLMLPYTDWGWEFMDNQNAVTRWAGAALAVSYTEVLGRRVVDSLLHIAFNDLLLPFIPVDVWAWLKKRPSLPPISRGWELGTRSTVVRGVRELGDVKLLESYFLLVWSEWDHIFSEDGFREMCASIREDFGAIRMWCHREVLIKQLDHVLGELDKGFEHLKRQKPSLDEHHIWIAKHQYGRLKDELLEVDRKVLTRTPFRLITLFELLTSTWMPQNLTPRSSVLSLSHVHSHVSATFALPSPNSVFHSSIGSPLLSFNSSMDCCPTLEHMCLPPPPNVINTLH